MFCIGRTAHAGTISKLTIERAGMFSVDSGCGLLSIIECKNIRESTLLGISSRLPIREPLAMHWGPLGKLSPEPNPPGVGFGYPFCRDTPQRPKCGAGLSTRSVPQAAGLLLRARLFHTGAPRAH